MDRPVRVSKSSHPIIRTARERPHSRSRIAGPAPEATPFMVDCVVSMEDLLLASSEGRTEGKTPPAPSQCHLPKYGRKLPSAQSLEQVVLLPRTGKTPEGLVRESG